MQTPSKTMTVARYLARRLEELGLKQLFGVAGNYTAPFLDTLLEDHSPIQIIGTPNELCAGYAADAYARLRGFSAVAVTYGVGSFSLLNPTAGSFMENAPVLVINGAPTNKEFMNERSAGLLYSHMMQDPLANLDVFKNVTVSAQRIESAAQAPYQIDAALSACLAHGRPVYLEVLEDVWRASCGAPGSKLVWERESKAVENTAAAVEATVELIERYGKPVFWAGVELQRQGLQEKFLHLLEVTGWSFTSSLLGKSVVSEDTPHFIGVYCPPTESSSSESESDEAQASSLSVSGAVRRLVNAAGCVIGLGSWTTGKETSNKLIQSDKVVLAMQGGVQVGAKYFPVVPLGAFIDKLAEALEAKRDRGARYAPTRPRLAALKEASATAGVTYDSFFKALDIWMNSEEKHQRGEKYTVISDAGFPLVGAQELHIREANGFVAQASWLSIGYSVAAAIGVKFAQPDRRPLVVVGDGAFQETCQAVSSHHYLKQDTVVFVLANGIYGIEQKLVNPNPFRASQTIYPEDSILNSVYSYNELHDWRYEKLTEALGGQGRLVTSMSELVAVLDEIDQSPGVNFVVNVRIPKTDTPSGSKSGLSEAGEDETANPKWPPALLF